MTCPEPHRAWTPRRVVALAAMATLCGGASVRGEQDEPGPRRPNVVLILSDDMGYGDFGFMGNERLQTPHLDAMAARSAWLPWFYVTPVCATTRATLLTGRYHPRTGVLRNDLPLDEDEVTLAEALADAGYATGIFGKWHLGRHYPHRPGDQGFKETLTFRGGILREYEPQPTEVRYTDPVLEHNGVLGRVPGYATDVFFDAALAWIERVHEEGRPFFAYLPTAVPHGPFSDVPAELFERYADLVGTPRGHQTASVYAMVAKLDQNVGKLFRRLGELALLEDTLVFFSNDNGPNGGEGARFVGGLSGAKGSIREGGIRSVLLAHGAGRFPAGPVTGDWGHAVDLVPTILAACGVEPPERPLDGRSLLPLLTGAAEALPERDVFFQANARGDVDRNYAVRSGSWKLVRDHGYHLDRDGTAELYDLASDPEERVDLAGEKPYLVRRLENSYAAWKADVLPRHQRRPGRSAIRLGTRHEEPLLLTKRHDPDTSPSAWDLRVVADGAYRVHLVFPPLPADGRATLVLARRPPQPNHEDPRLTVPVAAGADGCVFESVELPRGLLRLEAELVADRPLEGAAGVWQVRIERVRER